jgi:hypothetical protein
MMRPSAPVAHLLLPFECLQISSSSPSSSCEDELDSYEPYLCNEDCFVPVQFAPASPPTPYDDVEVDVVVDDEVVAAAAVRMNRPCIDFGHEGYRNEVVCI